jgi:UDP-glucose 4-epimerase
MKVLVTGGAGFIGSHLVDRLIKRGDEVVVLDNLSTGRKENINYKAEFIKGDIRVPSVFNKISNVGIVFHLAALKQVTDSFNRPKLYFDVNVVGSSNVLEFCRKNDAKIVFTSSASVYGDINKPAKEDDFCKPLSPYGRYKLFVEELIKSYNEFYGIPYSILRIFNVYGPRATSGVISNLVFCVKNGNPFYLYGDGKQKRDFIFIDDVVKILLLHKRMKNMTLNVGTGKPTSLVDLIEIFSNLVKNLKIIRKEKRKGEIEVSCPDITKLKKVFPKIQFTTLKKGILKCIT